MSHKLISMIVFLLLVVLAAAASSQFTGGEWYSEMNQPAWNPPAWFLSFAWGAYYVLMASSAWVVWLNRRADAKVALGWWLFQLLVGVSWSLTYFGLHRVGWALALMTIWTIAGLIVMNAFRSIRLPAAAMMAPVTTWLAFCWVLNFFQWYLNGGGFH